MTEKTESDVGKGDFEDLGHQLDNIGQTSVLGFYPRIMTSNL